MSNAKTMTGIAYSAPCPDCGERYSSTSFAGVTATKYCPPCRDRRYAAWTEEQATSRRLTVANMRREFREHPQRGIPRRYWGNTWEDFHFDRGGESNAGRVSALHKYANEFPVDAPPTHQKSIILAAQMNGVGKTMLASLIVGEIIGHFEKTGYERCPFQFWSANDIRMRLKAADRYGSKETQEEVYRDFATMWLLVMDDVGKEQLDGRDAGFTYEMYFNILDQRYNNQLPVVITSNLAPEPWEPGGPCLVDLMGRASVSRLGEMTGGMVYRIDGEDRR